MNIPEDPYMLASFINMKLRDDNYDNLEDLCASLSLKIEEIKSILSKAGFDYIEEVKQFR